MADKFYVIVHRAGLEPIAKRVAYDTPERQRLLTIELRRLYPEAVLIPVLVRYDLDLWCYSEKSVIRECDIDPEVPRGE